MSFFKNVHTSPPLAPSCPAKTKAVPSRDARPPRLKLSTVVPVDASAQAPVSLPSRSMSAARNGPAKLNTAPARTMSARVQRRNSVPLAKNIFPLAKELVLGCEFFRTCEAIDGFVDSVVSKFTLRTVPANTVFSFLGEQAEELFLIKEGSVSILSNDETVLTTRTNGELIGELALLSKGKRTANMRADCNTELLVLSAENFYVLCNEFSQCEEMMKSAAAHRVLTDSNAQSPATLKLENAGTAFCGSCTEDQFVLDHGLRQRFYLLDFNNTGTIDAASIAALLNRVDTASVPNDAVFLREALQILNSHIDSLHEIVEYFLGFSVFDCPMVVTETEFFIGMKSPVNDEELGGMLFSYLKIVLDHLVAPKEQGFKLLKRPVVRFICSMVMMLLLPLTMPLAAMQSRAFHRHVSARKRALDKLESEYTKAFNLSLLSSLSKTRATPKLQAKALNNSKALNGVLNMEAEVKVRRQEIAELEAAAPLAEQVFINFGEALLPTSMARRLRAFVIASSQNKPWDAVVLVILPWLLASFCYIVAAVNLYGHYDSHVHYMTSFEASGGICVFVLVAFIQAINVSSPKSQRLVSSSHSNDVDGYTKAVQQMMLNQYIVMSTQANVVTAQDFYNWIEFLHRQKFLAPRNKERLFTILCVLFYILLPGFRRITVSAPFFACHQKPCTAEVVVYQLCCSALYFLLLLMLADIARVYKQKLSRLRLLTRLTSRSDSAQVGLPFLSLDYAQNVDAWLQLRRAVLENDDALPSVALGTCAIGVSLVFIASLFAWNIITAIVGFHSFGIDPHNHHIADNDELLVRGSHIVSASVIGGYVIYAMTIVRDINSLSESHAELLLRERWGVAARLQDLEASLWTESVLLSKGLDRSPAQSDHSVREESARELRASMELLDRLVPVLVHRYHVTTILWFPVTTGFFLRLGVLAVTGIVTLVVRLIVD